MKQFTFITIILFITLSVGLHISIATQYDPIIYQAQQALKARGYDPGVPDGLWGKATERAVKYFQVDNDLPVTGKLDNQTQEKLGIVSMERSRSIGSPTRERRIALVIGNSAYKSSPLRNPVNDAQDMAATLKQQGFNVIQKEDADQRTMEDAIFTFSNSLKKGGVGLFYYAGHGVQVNGRNYLIPIRANIRAERDIRYEAVDAGRILDGMYDAGNGLNIVLLDACRDNPFARSFRTSSRGLARMDAPTGTFIAYATAPGATAADGTGKNGVFTEYFLKHMSVPGLKIEDVMKRVRNAVIKETGNKQVPWQASSLTRDFYFVSGSAIISEQAVNPSNSRMTVKSNISDARVLIGNREIGKTPLIDMEITPGEYRLVVEKAGYTPYFMRIKIQPGESYSVYAYLSEDKPKTSRLFVYTEPKNARVNIINIDRKFYQGMELKPANYHIEVSADDYKTEQLWIALVGGETKNLNIYLEPAPSIPEKRASIEHKEWIDSVCGIEFVWIPGECYEMGCGSVANNCEKDEKPVHNVCLDGFWISRNEITNVQYRKYKAAHSSKTYEGHSLNGDNQPVVSVSWEEAKDFAHWLTVENDNKFEFRLPTEAEWEYACRAGTKTQSYWGDNLNESCQYANVADQSAKNKFNDWDAHNCDDGYAVTSPAGSFISNKFGVNDIIGNVWEWCEDVYTDDAYSKNIHPDPINIEGGSDRVIRGGAWYYIPKNSNCSNRDSYPQDIQSKIIGFRLVTN